MDQRTNGKNASGNWSRQSFLGYNPKSKGTEAKIDKGITTKKLLHSKGKQQSRDSLQNEKMFANHSSDNREYKELINSSTAKNPNALIKRGK
jgi:hypothetical protein